MNLTNLNIFSVFSLITVFLSSGYLVYGLVALPLRKATTSFAILSSIVFIASVGSFISLTSINFHIITAGIYTETIGIILSPLALLLFTINIFETEIIKIRERHKHLFYLIPLFLIAVIFFSKGIHIQSSLYGYVINMEKFLIIIIIPYLVISTLLAILIIIFQIFRNNRFNRASNDAVILLVGFSIYFLFSSVYQILLYVFKIVPAIPSNTIFLFLLYITISISLLSSKILFENTSLKEAIKYSEDCIIITDSYGSIVEINSQTYKNFYGKNIPKNKYKPESQEIKSIMAEIFTDKAKAKDLVNYLSSDSTDIYKNDLDFISGGEKKYFNVIVSPIFDRGKKILGKLAIFRDTTENHLLQARLKEEAIIDFLTGTFNRRFFNESLLMEINRYKRYGLPFCLMIIDIDNFKKVNDIEGHLRGDYILTEAVRNFKHNIRNNLDIVARYGGDEFFIMLTNTSSAETEAIAYRILTQYHDMNLSGTTLSIGICSYKDNMEAEDIISCADKAMYAAKSNGGDGFSSSL
jgi:diguanylate cyclase (GGDEF)-like protein